MLNVYQTSLPLVDGAAGHETMLECHQTLPILWVGPGDEIRFTQLDRHTGWLMLKLFPSLVVRK